MYDPKMLNAVLQTTACLSQELDMHDFVIEIRCNDKAMSKIQEQLGGFLHPFATEENKLEGLMCIFSKMSDDELDAFYGEARKMRKSEAA